MEAADPDYVVMVFGDTSGLRWPQPSDRIFSWFAGYLEKIDQVGMVDVYTDHPSGYRWSQQLGDATSHSPCWLAVMRHKRLANP
jgi:hypothetical protein